MQLRTLVCMVSILFTYASSAQELSVSTDSLRLDLLSVEVDSFPHVQVVVKVSDGDGKPFWNLDSMEVEVMEGDSVCIVESVSQLTNPPSIDFCLVLDRSSSMLASSRDDISYLFYRPNREMIRRSSWNKAAYAIKKFQDSFDDSIHRWSGVVFNEDTRIVGELDSKFNVFNGISRFPSEGATAFYDALYKAADRFQDSTRPRYVVALTDGMDNSSSYSEEDVAERYKREGINLIVIGLGNVQSDTLENFTKAARGYYVYSSNASQLSSVYAEIAGRIKSLSQIRYLSANMSSADTSRVLSVRVKYGSIYSNKEVESFRVPDFMLEQMYEQEVLIAKRKRNRNLMWWGGGLVVLLGGGFVI